MPEQFWSFEGWFFFAWPQLKLLRIKRTAVIQSIIHRVSRAFTQWWLIVTYYHDAGAGSCILNIHVGIQRDVCTDIDIMS